MNLYLIISSFFFVGTLASINELDGRIVGGDFAGENELPHQVSLQVKKNGFHLCGGTILNKKYILTAAHCVTAKFGGVPLPVEGKGYQIKAGTINLLSGGVTVGVKTVKVHEKYSYVNKLYDIALLELEEELVFSDAIQPIEIATEELPIGSNVLISGWGRIYTNGPSSPLLKYTITQTISKEMCYRQPNADNAGLLCLLHPENQGACNGDSGGPAIYANKLVGVANFVFSRCGTRFPDAYAKVSHYADWIIRNIKY